MKVAVVIPARFASTRFPGKPLALIDGKPMIQHVYERVAKWKTASEVYVATDDETIAQVIDDVGGSCVISTEDYDTGTDRIADAIEIANIEADIVVNVQGDEPLISTKALDQLVAPFQKLEPIHATTLAHRIKAADEITDQNVVKVVFDIRGRALYFSRAPIPFGAKETYRHIGVYAFRTQILRMFPVMSHQSCEDNERLEQLRLLENGYDIGVIETEYKSIGVDVPNDVEKVEEILEKRRR